MRVNNRYVSFYYENDNDMGAIEIEMCIRESSERDPCSLEF